MPNVRQRVAARRDMVEHFVKLAENAGLETAERFLANAEETFNDLAGQPMIGASLTSQHPALAGLRKLRVKDFDHHLIFYMSIVRMMLGIAECSMSCQAIVNLEILRENTIAWWMEAQIMHMH